MTPSLALARCFHHPMREAVCRCPTCTRYFCRECITEHEGNFLCNRCVAESTGSKARGRAVGGTLLTSAMTAGAFLLTIAFYYLLGVIVAINFGRPGG
jgi:hypothetical protein